jgi:hypothetical protein
MPAGPSQDLCGGREKEGVEAGRGLRGRPPPSWLDSNLRRIVGMVRVRGDGGREHRAAQSSVVSLK